MKRSILALVLTAGAAHAQSFNIDFEAFSGIGAGLPGATFGGPAANPGTWNAVMGASPTVVPLKFLNGNPSSVTLARATNGSFSAANSGVTTGEYEQILDDFQQTTNGPMTFTFNNLNSGTYAIYVCGADPASVNNLSSIAVTGAQSSSQATQYIGGTMANNTFHAGVTHSVHFKDVTDGQLTITVSDGFLTRGIVSAIQIVQLPSPTPKTRLYVDKTAAGANDGGSWTNAMNDLQCALDAARLGGGSHFEVWVANSFYYPGTTRASTFNVAPGLTLYGGFIGNETSLTQRTSPLNNATYLSGSIGASGNTDDCYTVVTLTNPDNSTIVDGFYIARGHNDDTGHGGGMVIDGGFAAVIRNCDFTTNGASAGGAAIYSHGSYPRIIGCTFYNGNAWNGVGGAIEAAGPTGSLTVQNCRFLGNSAIGEGGAIYTSSLTSDIANCLFSGNSTSFQAGAIRAAGASGTTTLRNCTLSMNSSSGSCGGAYASGGTDIVIYNSIVWGNTGGTGASVADQGASANTVSGSTVSGSFNSMQGSVTDPLFINAAGPDGIPGNFDDNCRLRQGSFAMDYADINRLPSDIDDLNGNGVVNEPLPVDLDGNPRRVEILTSANAGIGLPPLDRGCYEFQLSSWCYVNCDDSVGNPVLNANDFQCFLIKYAAGDPYANCDGSGTAPVLNANDFQCFLNKFAQGCP